jgi:hypothetical protein
MTIRPRRSVSNALWSPQEKGDRLGVPRAGPRSPSAVGGEILVRDGRAALY